ncbi:hypothetical protein [Deinococcus sp. YIM 77859]|uniref:hypothetical protein n=1 Tax=Deinococcus sp. YIM 77859 TaxID=1540221 RepID=UPI00054F093B|nr:hypothetical protein [Deinococcus sp. YIM 77859]
MKANTKILALIAALAAGVAAAEGTPADTVITNTATATFTDPTTNQPVADPVRSNTVSTKVLPKPDFDIVYRTGADGTTATTTPLPAGYEQQTVPEQANGQAGEIATAYFVQNNGNVDGYLVRLAFNVNGSPQTPASVLYYIDTDGDGILSETERRAGAVTQVSVPVDRLDTQADEGVVSIIQVITVPKTAKAGEQYAASPQGIADVYDKATGQIIQQTEAASDLQYSRAVIYTPSITNNVIDGDNNTGNGQQTPGTTVTPPGTGTSVPGYEDPTRPTTNIVAVSPDNQIAYPKADGDSTADTVTFVNSLTNGGTLADTVRLFPTGTAGKGGSPSATPNPDGSFTLPDGVTVRFTDKDGNPLPLSSDNYPVLTVPSGQTLNYRTVVTYPDFDSNVNANPSPIVLNIGADSSNDGDALADDTSTDTVYPPQLQFGDATAELGTSPTPAPIQSVVPGAATGTGTGVNTDSSAVFPMDLANLGAYTDTYTLSGTVVVPVIKSDGTVGTQTVNVRYFSDNGGQPGTELSFTTNSDSTRTYTTGAVSPESELRVYAVVDIPANAQATTRNGVTELLTVNQRVTAVYSGITREDNNNQIAVEQPGNKGVALTKSEPAAARPGDLLSYTITAKNNFNAGLKSFYVTESSSNPNTNVFTWTAFHSVTATKTFTAGTVLYRFNGGTWQTSGIPASGGQEVTLNNGTKVMVYPGVTSVDIGVDTNGNGSVDSNDLFPAQGELNISFNVVIK